MKPPESVTEADQVLDQLATNPLGEDWQWDTNEFGDVVMIHVGCGGRIHEVDTATRWNDPYRDENGNIVCRTSDNSSDWEFSHWECSDCSPGGKPELNLNDPPSINEWF